MYTPRHFLQNDRALIAELIRNSPLATLVAHGTAGLFANHVPLLLSKATDDQLVLQGHIAKANEMAHELTDGSEVLAVFQGGNGYITPGWYPSKKTDGKVVPTWNYSAVHVSGVIRFIHDSDWKLQFLNSLTNLHESASAVPWKLSDAPNDYIARMMDGIVGFEIESKKIEAKWKLSQNQTTENRRGVIEGLEREGSESSLSLAEEIKRADQ